MTPLTTAGQSRALSLIFPMEYLFEQYVAASLRVLFRGRAHVHAGIQRFSLVQHLGTPWFALKPDLAISIDKEYRVILDAKWKRIDSSNGAQNYDLKQSDLYQLYAYGQKYLSGRGSVVLIYPRTPSFPEPLPPFQYDSDLSLRIIPFDPESGALTPDGEAILERAIAPPDYEPLQLDDGAK
jgi:5-methylcytosine-specific restriction enzyme subunit McrC